MKARAECKLRNGEVNFIVEVKAGMFTEAMDKLKVAVLKEFDHSFEADQWAQVSVIIERE
jgi:hypothetical protein